MRMKKRAYRATEIKVLDVAKLADTVRNERVIVATDVAKVDMVTAVELWDGTLVRLVKWKNPVELELFVDFIAELSRNARELECVQEPTGTYGDPVRAALNAVGLPVCRALPKRVHDLREAYDGTPSSHDAKAARIIAECHRRGWSDLWQDKAPDLHARQRLYAWFADEKQRLIGRLEGRLARHWPEVVYQLDLDSMTLLELLARYGGPRALAQDEAAARALMHSIGGRFLRPEKVESVLQTAATTVGVTMTPYEAEEMTLLAQELLRVLKRIKEQKRALERASEDLPCVRNLAEVVGTPTAVVLFAMLGNPCDYPSAAAYLKAAGLNLKEHSSGKRKGQLGITKRGPSVVRKLLYLAAMRMVQQSPCFKAWHEKKKARSGPRQGNKSIIALARKLAMGLWHVAGGSAWDPSCLFAADLMAAQG